MNNINESQTQYVVARQNGVLGSAVKDKSGKIIDWKSEKDRPIPNVNKSAFFKNEKRSPRPEIQRFKPETKAQIDARVATLTPKPSPEAPKPTKPAAEAPKPTKPAAEAPKPASAPSSSSFKWDPNKNIIAAKAGKLGIMDRGNPNSWREPSEQEKGEIPISSTEKFRSSAAGQEFLRQKGSPTSKTTSTGSSSSAKTGLNTWKTKYADTLAKNITPSGTQKGTGQSVMAKQAAELRALRPAPQAPGNEKPGYSGPPTPTEPQAQSKLAGGSYSSGATKLMSQRTKNVLGVKESYDAFDLVLEYLFSQGHVGTLDEALYVMMEMDSECIRSIAEGDPSYQVKRFSGAGSLTPSAAAQLGPRAVELQRKKASEVDLPNLKQSPGSMAKGA